MNPVRPRNKFFQKARWKYGYGKMTGFNEEGLTG